MYYFTGNIIAPLFVKENNSAIYDSFSSLAIWLYPILLLMVCAFIYLVFKGYNTKGNIIASMVFGGAFLMLGLVHVLMFQLLT